MKNFFAGLKYAFRGIKLAFQKGRNLRVQVLIGLTALSLAFLLRLSCSDVSIILIWIGLILGLEIMNTALEELCNFLHLKQNNKICIIKDISAGSVLLACLTAFFSGLIVFVPPVWRLIKKHFLG